jgi:hypothetical protein
MSERDKAAVELAVITVLLFGFFVALYLFGS